MAFFKERNKLRVEYSGFQEASEALRRRLILAYSFDVPSPKILQRELAMHSEEGQNDFLAIVASESYGEVFEAVEILANHYFNNFEDIEQQRQFISDVVKAFDLSGSVYRVDWGSGQVHLRVDEKTAQSIEEAKTILSQNQSAYEKFFGAVGDLFGRKRNPADIVKDIFVSFEDYLKSKMQASDFGRAIDKLMGVGIIEATQKALMDKTYAYRSDVYGSAHAGGSREPDEIDALWFLETVVAQIKLIDRRLKQKS